MLSQHFLRELSNHIPGYNILTSAEQLCAYSHDYSQYRALPDVVVLVENTAQVIAVTQLCNSHHIPLVARGQGTGTPGGAVPLKGGVLISFTKMNRILEIDVANRYARVEPGVINQTLQNELANVGLFWAPDPSSAATCTIGGNLAYNAAGPRAVKYGTTRENTLGLTAITGAGQQIRTGVFTTKGVVGYDLTRLLIGSEGTLALITEAILKLLPLPEAKHHLYATYKNVQSATDAICQIMLQPFTPCALEFIDDQCVNILRQRGKLALSADTNALLIIEIDGANVAIPHLLEKITQAARNSGLLEINTTADLHQQQALWQARKTLSPTLRAIAPKKISEDIVIPIANIPELVAELHRLTIKFDFPVVSYGHAGNGNLHVNLLVDSTDPANKLRIEQCLRQLFKTVLALRGTISGEHGIGIAKRDYITQEIDPITLNLMRNIKQQFDPNNILNPDKIFPTLSPNPSPTSGKGALLYSLLP